MRLFVQWVVRKAHVSKKPWVLWVCCRVRGFDGWNIMVSMSLFIPEASCRPWRVTTHRTAACRSVSCCLCSGLFPALILQGQARVAVWLMAT